MSHFIEGFESKAKRTIRRHRFIRGGERIGIAMSGGKDSSALLAFLVRTFGTRPDLDFTALTVDEGIGSTRDICRVREIAGNFDVPLVSTSFRREFGVTMEDIIARKGVKRSCTWCGILRRQALNRLARANDVNCIAMGFNLDDEAQSVLLNIFRGDTSRLTRPVNCIEGFIPRIKPFMAIPEREVALYAHTFVPGHDTTGCPYACNALRGEVRVLLNRYERNHPGTKYALVNLKEDLSHLGSVKEKGISFCPECGEPCAGACRACEILRDVRDGRLTGDL